MSPKNHPFAKFLYTHNPFYLLSASLVLYGLHVTFGERNHTAGAAAIENVWLLAGSLCGYTLLLALTAYLVVRLGRVWEDARSLALLVILMFVAISVSFDEICSELPSTASLVLTSGLLFAILVTEGLIRALEIKFPVGYRLPLYLTFGLFFLYPLWVTPSLSEQTDLVTAWRVFSFPFAAGIVTLTLIPAIRCGSAALRKNGTPWDWPWYPWPVFVFLAIGICFRSYVLTLSFQAARGLETSFSLYYLTPFAFATLVLLSEISFVERSRKLQQFVLCAIPALLIIACPVGRGEPFESFLASVVERLGSPTWLTLVGVTGFYGYLWARGIKHAEFACMAALLLMVNIGPQTTGFESLSQPLWWPLVMIGATQAIRCVVAKSSLRFMIAGSSLIAAFMLLSHDLWFAPVRGAISAHLAMAIFVVAGFAFKDRVALILRRLSPLAVVMPAMIVAIAGERFVADDLLRVVYIACLAGVSCGCWLVTHDRLWKLAILLSTGSVVVATASWIFTGVQHVIPPRALAALLGGVVCFLIAALISAMKGGFGKQLRRWFKEVWDPGLQKLEEDVV